jgi:hypothetical protein
MVQWRVEKVEGGSAMADVIDKIMAELESDPTIHAKNLNLVMGSKGFLKRRKTLEVLGTPNP